MTTSAPANRYFATSAELSTPVVAASPARTRPYRSAIQVRGSRASALRGQLRASGAHEQLLASEDGYAEMVRAYDRRRP